MSKKVLFFGNERLATGVATQAPVFRGLIEAGYQIEALIVAQKLDKHTDQLEIVKIARDNRIEIKSYPKLKAAAEEIKAFGVSAAVLAAYGKIVPHEILDLFDIGIINVHPSLLPKHRGPTPIESAILNGDRQTGVSIMRLASDMDAGPIYAQQAIELNCKETKQELADTLDMLGRDLLLSKLEDILEGRLKPGEQASEGATYDKLISKADGIINWHETWAKIDRMIRAYSIWPKARFSISGLDIAVLKAHYEDQKGEPGKYINFNGSLALHSSDGLAVLDQLLPASGKPMSGKDFILGYGKQLFN